MNNLLKQKEATNLLNVSRSTILSYEKQGVLRPVRVGKGQRQYLVKDIEGLLHAKQQMHKEG